MKYFLALAVTLTTPAAADAPKSFMSPTGNIACVLFSDTHNSARCDIREFSPSHTEPPPDCGLDWGGSYEVFDTGPAVLACVGDTIFLEFGPVLDYGEQISAGSIVCRSERTGMTCTNQAGHGFTLTRARQTLF
jgi:hypothetical protein